MVEGELIRVVVRAPVEGRVLELELIVLDHLLHSRGHRPVVLGVLLGVLLEVLLEVLIEVLEPVFSTRDRT